VPGHTEDWADRTCAIGQCANGCVTTKYKDRYVYSASFEGAGKRMHIIDHAECIRCGTRLEVCLPRFAVVNKNVGQRELIRKSIPPYIESIIALKAALGRIASVTIAGSGR